MDFREAFLLLMEHEGWDAIVRRPHADDPGGLTKWGISQRAFPHLDIAALTERQAMAVYHKYYWAVVRADDLPEWVRFDMFGATVHHGPAGMTEKGPPRSIRWLQVAVGVAADGVIGPMTLQAVRQADIGSTMLIFNALRLQFMTDRGNWHANSRGWARRIVKNMVRVGRQQWQ